MEQKRGGSEKIWNFRGGFENSYIFGGALKNFRILGGAMKILRFFTFFYIFLHISYENFPNLRGGLEFF